MKEPNKREVAHFLELVKAIPATYFGRHQPHSPDYGTLYSDVYVVVEWLEKMADHPKFDKSV